MSNPLEFGVSYLNLCMDAVVDRLKLKLQTEIDPGDETYAGLVRAGKLQNDTALKVTSVVAHMDDGVLHLYNDFKWQAQPFEIGSPNAVYHEKFIVQFSFFFRGETDRDAARRKANVVVSRARAAVMTMSAPAQVDDFGERPLERHPLVTRLSVTHEGGGVGTFIWKGTMHVAFLTEVEPEMD